MATTKLPWVTVRVAKTFDTFVVGELFQTQLTERMQALVDGGFLEVVPDGTGKAGPGSALKGDQGGSTESAPVESDSDAEPGQGFGSSGYGTAES